VYCATIMDNQPFRTLAAEFDALAAHLRECNESKKRMTMIRNMAALLREIDALGAGEHQSLDQLASEPRTEAVDGRIGNP
jgi:hypothetical protein